MRTIAFALSLAFIFCIPWEGVVNLPVLSIGGSSTGAKMIGLALAAIWVLSVLITGRVRKPEPFHIVVCIFVLWNAVSVFWSADPNNTAAHVLTWVQLIGFVLIVWDLYTTRAAILAGLQAFIIGEYVAVGIAVANYLSGNVFYTHHQRFSPAAETNPDGFGFIVVLGVPVAWYLAASTSNTRPSHWFKLANYAYIPAAFLGLALSGTRTALIAAIPGMAFGLASLTRLTFRTRVAIFLLLTSTILVLLPHVQPMSSFQRLGTTYAELTEGDLNNRTNNWREGLESFAEHPLLGVGSNMYRSVSSLGKQAHNSFLSVLVEVGLIGFGLFTTILLLAVIQAWGHSTWDKSFWLSLLMVWAIGASTLTWEHRKTTWLFLGLVIASAALTSHHDERVPLAKRTRSVGRFLAHGNMNESPHGE